MKGAGHRRLRTPLNNSALLGFLLLIAGCSAIPYENPSYTSSDSGIVGHLVHTKRQGAQVTVAGAAAGTVYVSTPDRSQTVANVTTDAQGGFTVSLRPGKYFVYVEVIDYEYGRRVTVTPGRFTDVEFHLPPGF